MAEVTKYKKAKIQLMFDSGMFSAWSRNEELSMTEYVDYLKEHKKYLYSYVTFDVVPKPSSTNGAPPTRKETERSGAGSYENHQMMKSFGLGPIPVFHQGESFKWLIKYIEDGEDYIGISTWKTNMTQREQIEWLDRVFTLITDRRGKPIVKTHGFGIASPKLMMRYPWFSVDSTTWVLSAGFGKIFMPQYHNGKPDYRKLPVNVVMSGRSTVSKATAKLQFENLGESAQELVRKFLKEEINVSVTEAKNIPEARRLTNLIYYKNLCAHLHDMHFKHRKGGLLNPIASMNRKALRGDWSVSLMCATNLSKSFSHIMNKADADNRLLSYYELRDKPDHYLKEYVEHGIIDGPYVQRTPSVNWNSETYLVYRFQKFLKRQAELEAYDA